VRNQREIDESMMRRCLQLAAAGDFRVAPNPRVGAVITYRNQIIGEGYHRNYGEAHAEVNAIRAAQGKADFKQCTIYVNLEPCAHYGKTPPCADLIVRSGFKRVVIANTDPFEAVDGKGIDRLRKAKIEVVTKVLHDEGRHLNRRFFTFHEKKRPYIILKWAQSADGFVDRIRNGHDPGNFWISSPSTRKLVHLWRAQEAAILIGSRSVAHDNPELTVRDVDAPNPLRIVFDPNQRLDFSSRVFNAASQTLYACSAERLAGCTLPATTSPIPLLSGNPLPELLSHLHQRQVQSVLVEGGKHTHQQLLDAGLWDEIRVLVSSRHVGEGSSAPHLPFQPHARVQYGDDQIITYFKA